MEFKRYYAALLRGGHGDLRIDEAIRDYQDMLQRISAAGIY
jgi:hypothetical protein